MCSCAGHLCKLSSYWFYSPSEEEAESHDPFAVARVCVAGGRTREVKELKVVQLRKVKLEFRFSVLSRGFSPDLSLLEDQPGALPEPTRPLTPLPSPLGSLQGAHMGTLLLHVEVDPCPQPVLFVSTPGTFLFLDTDL